MGKSVSFNVIVHKPQNTEEQQELARRAACIHAEYVIDSIQQLNCPTEQKLALLEKIITMAKQNASE